MRDRLVAIGVVSWLVLRRLGRAITLSVRHYMPSASAKSLPPVMQFAKSKRTRRCGFAPLAAALALFAFASACSNSPDVVRIIDSDVIDSLLDAAPQTFIDLDARPAQEWSPNGVLGVHPRDSLILSGKITFALAGDSVYIADADAHAIFVAGLDGVLRRQVGRLGHGPLEFDELMGFASAGSRFFVQEVSRMQVLSGTLEYEDVVLDAHMWPAGYFGTFGSSDSRLYYPCTLGHTHRVCSRDARPPFAEGKPFLPAVEHVAGGHPLNILNMLSVSASPGGRYVMAAFFALPHVFVFDEAHRHIHTISLSGDVVKAHAPNFLMSEPGVPGAGIRSLIYGIYVLNGEFAMVQIRELWYVLRFMDGGSAEHVGTVRLMADPAYQVGEITDFRSPSETQLHRGRLYVTNTRFPYILRYAFPYQDAP